MSKVLLYAIQKMSQVQSLLNGDDMKVLKTLLLQHPNSGELACYVISNGEMCPHMEEEYNKIVVQVIQKRYGAERKRSEA